jgi:hypothetical protein
MISSNQGVPACHGNREEKSDDDEARRQRRTFTGANLGAIVKEKITNSSFLKREC